MSNELLPCPFCGNSQILARTEIVFLKGSPSLMGVYHAYCNKCWIKTGHFESEKLLIEFWNKTLPREKYEPDTFAKTDPQTHWLD